MAAAPFAVRARRAAVLVAVALLAASRMWRQGWRDRPSGPTYSVRGTVQDAGNHNLLAGVTVRLSGTAGLRHDV